jgi:hypothetical protein
MLAGINVRATYIKEVPVKSKMAGIASKRGFILVLSYMTPAVYFPGLIGVGFPFCYYLFCQRSLTP